MILAIMHVVLQVRHTISTACRDVTKIIRCSQSRFLRERQPGSLAMVHLAEAVSEPLDKQIIRIRQTLELVPAENEDPRLHLGVLLAKACKEKCDTR